MHYERDNGIILILKLHASDSCILFFFNDTATTEIYTLSLHDALPISKFPLNFKKAITDPVNV